MLIPRGFAHGFQAMTEDCELLYAHSDPYQPASEGALNALDPALGDPLAAAAGRPVGARPQTRSSRRRTFRGSRHELPPLRQRVAPAVRRSGHCAAFECLSHA